MEYYIVSLKHTSVGDTALTFWRANGMGYTWDKETAGIYSEAEIRKYVSDDNIPVNKPDADGLWRPAVDFEDKFMAIENSKENLINLGLADKKNLMKERVCATCKMIFQ